MVYHPFRHLGLKFLSVGVALGLWFTVAGERTVERTLQVPLLMSDPPEQIELVESPPGTVEVRVRGASGLLSQLSPGAVVATIDLSQAREGRRGAYLTPSQVRAPVGVEVVRVNPPMVPLRFEKLVTKTVQVVPAVEGEPAPGFVAGEATVEPASVEVSGAESAMKDLKKVTTEPVSVSGQRSQVRATDVSIDVRESSLRLTKAVTATVTVPILPTVGDRLFTAVPVGVRNAGRGGSVQVVPTVVAVVVRGPKDVVEALRPDQVAAFVDLAGLGSGRYNRPVQIDPPKDLVVVRTEPATVQVRIK
jgi:YbbR domain-containing protein